MNEDNFDELLSLALTDENTQKTLFQSLNKTEIPLNEIANDLKLTRREAMQVFKKITAVGIAKLKIGRRGKETRLIFTCGEVLKSNAVESIKETLTLDKAKKIYFKILHEGAWPHAGHKSLKEAVVSSFVSQLALNDNVALNYFYEIEEAISINESSKTSGIIKNDREDMSERIKSLVNELKKLTSAKEVNLKF